MKMLSVGEKIYFEGVLNVYSRVNSTILNFWTLVSRKKRGKKIYYDVYVVEFNTKLSVKKEYTKSVTINTIRKLLMDKHSYKTKRFREMDVDGIIAKKLLELNTRRRDD